MSAVAARRRYLADQVSTASPAALIVMLYDRLALDLEVATTAYAAGQPLEAGLALSHAQRIVGELLTSLDPTAWTGAADLAALYRYLLDGLITARAAGHPAALRGLAAIVASLRAAWAQAAVIVAGGPTTELAHTA